MYSERERNCSVGEIENLIANGPLGSLITTEASSRSDYNGDTDNV